MNGFSAIVPGVSTFVPVLGDILVTVLLSRRPDPLQDLANAATHKADAVQLELGKPTQPQRSAYAFAT